MSKYNSPSPLSGVTFEEIMSEAEVSSDYRMSDRTWYLQT